MSKGVLQEKDMATELIIIGVLLAGCILGLSLLVFIFLKQENIEG